MNIKALCLGSGIVHPSFGGLGRIMGWMVKLAKLTVLYSALNPKNLDVERLSLITNPNTLSTNQACN